MTSAHLLWWDKRHVSVAIEDATIGTITVSEGPEGVNWKRRHEVECGLIPASVIQYCQQIDRQCKKGSQ